jgi:PAS domain-containing protein
MADRCACFQVENGMKSRKKTTQDALASESAAQSCPIVALGASAGGLEALQDFFDRMPSGSGMAFMVIQHLSPDGKSLLKELLQKRTLMKVTTAEEKMRVEPNCVYLNPAGKAVEIFNGEFQITDPVKTRGISFPIDHFFRSLAADQGERAICVILSGTVSSELQAKVDELTEANNDIINLLGSTEIGTIFLDVHLGIKRLTPSMTKLFRLLPSDIGRSLKDFTTNVAYPDLYREAETVLDTLQTKQVEVRTEENKWFSMRILPYRTRENVMDGVVITFVDVTGRKDAEELIREARIYAESIVDTVRAPLLTLDPEFRVVSSNRQFYRIFKTTPEETENRRLFELENGQWDIPGLRELLNRILIEGTAFDDFEVEHQFPLTGSKRMLLNARKIVMGNDRPELILLSFEDSTPRDVEVAELRAAIKELETGIEEMKRACSTH